MYQRYLGYRAGKEPLPAMAYFCFTVLKRMGEAHGKAATRFGVSNHVLDRIRILSSRKGGASARKEDGRDTPLTPEEERFLRSSISTLIRRAAEVEHGPDPSLSRAKITLADI